MVSVHPIVSFCLLLIGLTRGKECGTAQSISPDAFVKISFDYVIIGGGTAGLTIASRLAEDLSLAVGVIEAGSFHFDDPLVNLPSNIGVATGNSDYDWLFKSAPQRGLNNATVLMPRGKMVGGSSGLNSLAWNRASRVEYDAWRSLVPRSSWDWNGLLPYLKHAATTMANQTNPFPGIPGGSSSAGSDPKFVGFDGPINSSYNVIYADPVPTYVETLNAIGIPTNANPESGTTSGVYNTRNSINRAQGVRSYSRQYYCRSASQRNFHLLAGATVKRVLFSKAHPETATASGVLFSVGAASFKARVKKEVILSAGTIQTPQLLELSGIGNPKILRPLNIPTVVNLPQVGENYQEHLFTAVEYLLKPGVLTFDELRNNVAFASQQAAIYQASKGGFLAAVDSTLTFLPFQLFLNSAQVAAQLERFEVATRESGSRVDQAQFDFQRTWLKEGKVPQVELVLFNQGLIAPEANKSYITVFGGAMHPVARGSVHINTSSVTDSPVIDPRFLTNDFDRHTLLEGLKLLLRIGNLAPLSTIVDSRVFPPDDVRSDEDLIEYIKNTGQVGSHPIGTAAMGPRDRGGVVDGNLKVYGTSNVRVVDASVIPLHIGAHIQSTVYAIAEKAAEIIKGSK